MQTPTIRRIRAVGWRDLKRLRLEAVADAPLAFGSTLEQEEAFSDGVWQRRTADAAAGRTGTLAVAAVGDEWVAMAAGVLADEDPATAYLVSVYVTPAWRGRNLGRLVSAEVVAWAGERGLRHVLLHVARQERLGAEVLRGDRVPRDRRHAAARTRSDRDRIRHAAPARGAVTARGRGASPAPGSRPSGWGAPGRTSRGCRASAGRAGTR